jgi:branched-chain amino acid transport system substrate-binding protein
MRPRRAGVAALLAVILSAVCGTAEEHTIMIGAMYNLTGGQHDLDIPSSEGARLAVAEANEAGGLLGRPVQMILVDGRTEPQTIAAEATKLLDGKPAPVGLIGFSDTDMVLAAAPIAARYKRLFLTSGATSPQLPQQVPEYLFLACFGDNVQAAAGADWAYGALKARTVAVLYKEASSYAQLLQGYFETSFKELGGQVLAVQPYTLDDIKQKAGKLPAADLIYLAAQPDDVAAAISALRGAGIATPILGGDGLDIGEAWRGVPEARDVYFTTHAYLGPDNPAPEVQRFRALFAKAYPGQEPDAFSALGYDTARLLMAAIRTAGSADPERVRAALAATTGFQGVTGTISYRNGSRIPTKSVTIISVDRGRQKFIGSVLPERIPAP